MTASLYQRGSDMEQPSGRAALVAGDDQRVQQRIDVGLTIEAVSRLRPTIAADADRQQLRPVGRLERVFVGFVVTDVERGVARKLLARLLQRQALVAAILRQQADRL